MQREADIFSFARCGSPCGYFVSAFIFMFSVILANFFPHYTISGFVFLSDEVIEVHLQDSKYSFSIMDLYN